MVKSDDHMLKIKQRLIDDASSKKASEDAKKLRDAKKFGKAVQIAKEQERAKEKRQTLEKIEAVKRKRKRNPAAGGEREDERMFDIELEEAGKEDKNRRDRRRTGGLDRDASSRGAPNKRQKKNEKFGFGGRKRFGKSGDAISSGDLRGFSVGRMKGRDDAGRGGAKGGERRIKKPQKRLGKSRRAKQGR